MGTIINIGLIIVGSVIGLLVKKKLNKNIAEALKMALGIGIILLALTNIIPEMIDVSDGVIKSKNGLLLIISLVSGTLIGELLALDARITRFETYIQAKFSHGNFTKGFIEATLLYGVGAMAIIGALADGVSGDYSILLAKGMMDGISSVILTATVGSGVILSIFPLGIYQGTLTILAKLLSPHITAEILSMLSLTGFTLVLCLGLNTIKITKIKVINMLPAIIIPLIIIIIRNFI